MTVSHAATMARNGNFRMAAVESAPESVFARIYNTLTGNEISLRPEQAGDRWWLNTPERSVRLVRAHDALRITHIGDDPGRRVYDRYVLSDDVEPQDGDHVVDIGAFIGEFSWQVAERHDVEYVHAIEPDPRTATCLRHNLVEYDAAVTEAACYYESGEGSINVASDPTETGLLVEDKGTSYQATVDLRRLDDVVGAVDFLKVEAEGCEPEVLAGLGQLDPERVVVNVSPERDGSSPASICDAMLKERGYTTERQGRELFAWK